MEADWVLGELRMPLLVALFFFLFFWTFLSFSFHSSLIPFFFCYCKKRMDCLPLENAPAPIQWIHVCTPKFLVFCQIINLFCSAGSFRFLRLWIH
jgi:hypothetical protein